MVAHSGGIPDKKKSEEIKSWFLPNTFHVFLVYSPTLSLHCFLVHLPCLCFRYGIKTHVLQPPNMAWRNETPQESSKPSPTHWHFVTSNFVDWPATGLSDSLLKDRQCWNTQIWSKLIDLLLIFIISMRSVPLQTWLAQNSVPLPM